MAAYRTRRNGPMTQEAGNAATSPERDVEGSGGPDLMELVGELRGPLGILALATLGIFCILLFAALKVSRPFVLPVVAAVLLNFLLSPVVRFLRGIGLPSVVGTSLVLLGLAGATAAGVERLTRPAAEWIDEASRNASRVERELRGISEPVEDVQEAVEEVEEAAGGGEEAAGESRMEVESDSGGSVVGAARTVVVGFLVMFFLLFFLLSSGDQFLRKLATVLPEFRHRRTAVDIVRRTEGQVSTYLFTMGVINLGLGVLIGLAMWLLGMPNPALWGVMAAFLNFVPYVGPVVGIAVTGMVAVVTFEATGRALAVPATYLALNGMEGYLVTPLIMGRSLALNPVAIFLSVVFWGWLWGIPGALLAVPLLAVFKIMCDNIDVLSPIGEFLGR